MKYLNPSILTFLRSLCKIFNNKWTPQQRKCTSFWEYLLKISGCTCGLRNLIYFHKFAAYFRFCLLTARSEHLFKVLCWDYSQMKYQITLLLIAIWNVIHELFSRCHGCPNNSMNFEHFSKLKVSLQSF